MPPNRSPGPALLAQLQRIHRAMLVGQGVFLIVGFLANYYGNQPDITTRERQLFWLLGSAGNLLIIGLGFVLFYFQLRQARKASHPGTKLRRYFLAAVLRLGLLNGANLFNLYLFMTLGDKLVLGLFVLLLLLFVRYNPSRRQVILQLKLNPKQAEQLFPSA